MTKRGPGGGEREGASSSLHFYQELVLILNKFMPLHSLIALAYNDLLLWLSRFYIHKRYV